MYFKTTEAHEQLRAEIREWAEREIKPIAFTLDKENRFPREQIADFGKRGYLGLPYPEEYGGMGKDILSYAIGVEELSRVDGGTGVILSAHVSRCLSDFCLRYGRTEAKISCAFGKG